MRRRRPTTMRLSTKKLMSAQHLMISSMTPVCYLDTYQDLSQGSSTLCRCVAVNLHFHNAQILLMLFLVGVWSVQWESLGEANKHPPAPSPLPPPPMWLHVAAKFTPKLADLLASGGKNARKFTAKIVHKLGSCRGLWRAPPVRVLFCGERHLHYFHPPTLSFNNKLRILVNKTFFVESLQIFLCFFDLQVYLCMCILANLHVRILEWPCDITKSCYQQMFELCEFSIALQGISLYCSYYIFLVPFMNWFQV